MKSTWFSHLQSLLSSFFSCLFLFLFSLLCQCFSISRMSHNAFFEHFRCDIKLCSTTNAMELVLHCIKNKIMPDFISRIIFKSMDRLKYSHKLIAGCGKLWFATIPSSQFLYTSLDKMNKLLQDKIWKIKPVSIYYTLPPICDCNSICWPQINKQTYLWKYWKTKENIIC